MIIRMEGQSTLYLGKTEVIDNTYLSFNCKSK